MPPTMAVQRLIQLDQGGGASDNPSDSKNNGSPPSNNNPPPSDNNPPPQDKQCDSLECKTPPPPKEENPICPDVFPPLPGCGPIKEKPKKGGPDDDCQIHPELDKCKSDNGKCPPGFGNNENDHCYKQGPCPPGFAREDDDESGACKKLEIKCPPGFEVKKGVCNKDIIINIIKHIKTVSSSSAPGAVTMSKVCYNVISVVWNAGIKKGQDKNIDDFIAGCLK
jgi:hypothetical protein